MAEKVKCLSTMRETWVRSLGQEDSLEKEMATHSSTLALKIPWTEELGASYCPWGRKESGTTERLHFHLFLLLLHQLHLRSSGIWSWGWGPRSKSTRQFEGFSDFFTCREGIWLNTFFPFPVRIFSIPRFWFTMRAHKCILINLCMLKILHKFNAIFLPCQSRIQ